MKATATPTAHLNFDDIDAELVGQVESIANKLFPDKKVEKKGPWIRIGTQGSLAINADNGHWTSFEDGGSGPGMVSLTAYAKNISRKDAAEQLIGGITLPPTRRKKTKTKEKEPANWRHASEPPASIPDQHFQLGVADHTYRYCTPEGTTVGAILRWDAKGKNPKEIRAVSWIIQDGKNKPEWKWHHFAEPRPLYGCERLAKQPGAPVVIVEGEKCADALQAVLPDYVVLTWPGGSSPTHIKKANWRPLSGRTVTVWPDADEPGRKAAGHIKKLNPDAQIVDTSSFTDGWDAADAITDGWDAKKIMDLLSDSKASEISDGVFYDGVRYYWRHEEKFVSMDISSLRRHLKRAGIKASKDDTEVQSQLDELICQIQLDNSVEFAGPMAGHGIGKHGRGDGDFLVTRPPCFIRAEAGDRSLILRFIDGLLGTEQAKHFIYWLRASMMNLESYAEAEAQYRPAPAIVLAGPRDCGKTFLVTLLAKLFGRAQSANLWLSGGSEFNSDLAGSELLTVDDDIGLADGKTRSQISAKIKGALFSGDVKIHPKGKQAFSARPFWRIVYAVNDEPEAMMVLPKLDASMEDKLALFQCYKSELPLAELSRTEREKAYSDQLPAFVDYLHNVKVDSEMEATRSGCYCWQSPELLDALNQLSPEHKMLALIDDAMGDDLPFEGTAREIESRLKGDGATAGETSRLLTYPNRAGLYLSRLASSAPDRVQKAGNPHNVQHYLILPEG